MKDTENYRYVGPYIFPHLKISLKVNWIFGIIIILMYSGFIAYVKVKYVTRMSQDEG